MVQIQGYTLHLVTLASLSVGLAPFGHYTSERLTGPYSGELPACAALSQLANMARLPVFFVLFVFFVFFVFFVVQIPGLG